MFPQAQSTAAQRSGLHKWFGMDAERRAEFLRFMSQAEASMLLDMLATVQLRKKWSMPEEEMQEYESENLNRSE